MFVIFGIFCVVCFLCCVVAIVFCRDKQRVEQKGEHIETDSNFGSLSSFSKFIKCVKLNYKFQDNVVFIFLFDELFLEAQ